MAMAALVTERQNVLFHFLEQFWRKVAIMKLLHS